MRSYVRRVLSSVYVKRLRHTPARLRHEVLQAKNRPYYALDFRSRVGFFGLLQTYLYVLYHCDKHQLLPSVRFIGGPYAPSSETGNWLTYYFTYINTEEDDNSRPDVGRLDRSQ